ncbi:MAG: hypothetical protein JWM72_2761, partial [Actinomycetia bacterium]|nr:hypothetical protein [Actinomycetes bacterium]
MGAKLASGTGRMNQTDRKGTAMETTAAVRIEGETIVAAFRNTVRRAPDRPALRTRVEHGWHTMSYADYGRA